MDSGNTEGGEPVIPLTYRARGMKNWIVVWRGPAWSVVLAGVLAGMTVVPAIAMSFCANLDPGGSKVLYELIEWLGIMTVLAALAGPVGSVAALVLAAVGLLRSSPGSGRRQRCVMIGVLGLIALLGSMADVAWVLPFFGGGR
jgi:hypothetical protein